MKTVVKKIAIALALLITASIFVSLGLWQASRANQLQEVKRELDAISKIAPVALSEIHQPRVPLDGQFVNRKVEVSGRYVAQFIARGQESGDLEVALLEVSDALEPGAILVARQAITGGLTALPQGEVRLQARLLPAQQEDRDPSARLSEASNDLVRISGALLEGDVQTPLYDGYLLLQSEVSEGVSSQLRVIPDQIARPTVPGYYWQHIAYVVIWFLMAVVTLYLPFYQRRRTKLLSSNGESDGESASVARSEP